MGKVKKCPKCRKEMVQMSSISDGHGAIQAIQLSDGWPDYQGKVVPFYCRNCGYIELYNEENIKKE